MPAMTLEELFYQYLDEHMTEDELRLFREMASREENRAELNRLFAEWVEQDFPFAQPEEIDVEALYLELTSKKGIPVAGEPIPAAISTEISMTTGRRAIGGLRHRIVVAVMAVAAVCLLGVTGYFLLHRPGARRATPPVVKAPVIVPAGNRATLTLADGRRVVLDSAADGNLTVQGNTQVIKLAGGQLVYRDGAGSTAAAMTYNVMTTPRGGYYQVILPDGSKVWLDAASSLRYPTAFSGKDRAVELSGEAYFEIAPRADQPFLVTSNGITVQVLGTEFNLMAYSDEDAIRTTLVKGSVRVVCGKDLRQVLPGQQTSWKRGGSAWQVSVPDINEVLAWKQGEFRFRDLDIPAIMRQIARWYDVDIEYVGKEPTGEFTGVIPRKKDVADLLAVLEQTDEVFFTLRGRKIIVQSH
jgi:transmembrane sensor